MATNREKFIELRKSGLDPVQAREKVFGKIEKPIVNAPVAGVAPAITPPPTETPVAPVAPVDNKQVLDNNQAKVQAEIASGERPAAGTQATPAQVPEIVQQVEAQKQPVTQTAPIETPAPVTPTQPTQPVSQPVAQPVVKAPTAPKIEAPIAPPTPRQIASQQNFNKYNSMSSQQFVDLMKQGQIPSEISGQLTQTNPQFQQAQQEYSKFLKTNNINSGFKAVYNGLTGQQTPPQTNPLEEISNKFMKLLGADANDMTYVEAFKNSLTNNETLRTKTQNLNAKQAEINEKVKARDDLLKQYKLTYKDTPLAILVAMASQDAQPINEEIATLQSERDQLKADVTYETELAKGEYDAQVKDMETKAGIRNSILSNLMSAEMGIATEQIKANIAEETAKRAMNDPVRATTALIEEYKKLGVPFTRSTQEIVREAQAHVANGGNLADYLTELQKTIQGKDVYKAIQAYNADKMKIAPTESSWELATVNGRTVERNKYTGSIREIEAPVVGVKGTGNIVPVTAGGKTVRLDQAGATGFENAVNQLTANGTPIVIGEGARDQVATIKSMADRYGITFNASNPSETAQKLRSAGHQVADPGKSKHENGMAIDVYGSDKLDAVTPEQEKVLNANGWYSAGIPGDAGHFEYRGGVAQAAGTPIANLGQFMKDNQDRGQGYSNDDVKAFNEKIDRLVKEGDEEGMAMAYRNMVMKDKDFKKEFDDTTKFTKSLDTVEQLINEYEQAGKSTNALKSLAEKVGRKLGLTQDEALARMQTQLGVTMADYIRSISGTAASDVEVQRLMGNMANIGNVKDLNTAIVGQVRANAMNGLKQMIDNRMYGMPEELKPQVFGDIYQKATPENNIMTVVNNLVPNSFRKYFK